MSESPHVSYREWRDYVQTIAGLRPPRTRVCGVLEAHGTRLAEPLIAREPAPAFAMSAMDGFAVRAADLNTVFARAEADGAAPRMDVSGDIAAGSALRGELRDGAAVRIMTGAPVPPGFDLVVPVEYTDADPHASVAPTQIALTPSVATLATNAHIRAVGEEIAQGERLAEPGEAITSQLVGIALAVGTTHVEVEKPRTVAIIMTGDELVTERHANASSANPVSSTDIAPGGGAVLESNGPMLAAALAELGVEASIHHVSDSPADLVGLARSLAPRNDLIITTGGVGSGARDVVKAAFGPGTHDASGLECSRFEHVHMRPGGPQGVGRLHVGESSTPMIHLPGTPVGALVGFHLFVRTVLGIGRDSFQMPSAHVHLAPTQRPPKTGTTVRPATLNVHEGTLVATEIPGPRLRPFTHANALIVSDGSDTVTITPLS